ncbi:MAG: carbohydrate kinase family protein [Gemmatimonadetes bacterium]|nr:carbohydrate kinase family protein [Gemmatimonadota bacterium]
MSSVTWDVVGVGANSVDTVLLLPEAMPRVTVSAKIRLRGQSVRCGGQTTTTVATCAALGLKAKYVGVIGRDEEGRRLREALARRGVNIAHVIERDVPTQTATILVHLDAGSRIVLSDRDIRLSLRPDDVPIEALHGARVVHVDDVDVAAAIEAASAARAADVPVTSDIDHVSNRTEELLSLVTHPIFSEEAPQLLTGIPDSEEALRELRHRHTGLLCVTLGERGAMALDGDRVYHQPAFPVVARDTTGAGDVFRGGFIYGLLRGWSVPDLLEFAAAAAAVSCTRLGALDSVPMLEDVEHLLRTFGKGAVGSGQLETETR